MTIPYYAKDEGIKTHEGFEGEAFYVILDKLEVDKISLNVWETFDAIKEEVEEELKQFLDFGEVFIAISPQGDGTYILNFIGQPIESNGGLLL